VTAGVSSVQTTRRSCGDGWDGKQSPARSLCPQNVAQRGAGWPHSPHWVGAGHFSRPLSPCVARARGAPFPPLRSLCGPYPPMYHVRGFNLKTPFSGKVFPRGKSTEGLGSCTWTLSARGAPFPLSPELLSAHEPLPGTV